MKKRRKTERIKYVVSKQDGHITSTLTTRGFLFDRITGCAKACLAQFPDESCDRIAKDFLSTPGAMLKIVFEIDERDSCLLISVLEPKPKARKYLYEQAREIMALPESRRN
jgi:hypothetical protein